MASFADNNRPLTESELDAIRQHIMENGIDTGSEFSDVPSEHSDHNTDSEQEYENDVNSNDQESAEENGESSGINYYYGKNKFKWAKIPPAPSRTRRHNIVSHLPGVIGKARAKNPTTPLQAWECLIDEEILQTVLDRTNERITEMAARYNKHNLSCQYTQHTDTVELRAFLGLLYLSGVFKSNNEDLRSLFATDGTGRDIFRGTMSLNRFYFLLSALRFDDRNSRPERIRNGDKLAAISEVFELFIANCRSNYSVGEYVTVDEMLIAFRGRCSFRMYLKNKPDKYGLKLQCICDAKTHYLLNAFVYTGKDTHSGNPNPKKLSIPTQDVLSLIPPIANSNRNITGDNWFTSLELVNELKSQNLTYVGTIRKNKREIPSQFLPNNGRSVNSTVFGFTKDYTLISHVPKKNRAVLLISSMHHDNSIIDGKPEIINFYNETKGGVDTIDQKCSCYKVGRRTRRWPQTIWFRIMDIAGVNANVIHDGILGNKKTERRAFLTSLGRDLIQDHLLRRSQQMYLPRELRSVIGRITGTEVSFAVQAAPEPQAPLAPQNILVDRKRAKRGRCHICPYSQNKESSVCDVCNKFICKNHRINTTVCKICQEK